MKRSLVVAAILFFMTIILEVAWVWPSRSMSPGFHLLFVVVATLTFIHTWQKVLWYALGLGFILDLYSPQVFGISMATSVLLVLLIAVLKASWLKQPSLLSVATISALSLAIVQSVALLVQWGSEELNFSSVHVLSSMSLLGTIGGLLAMVFATTIVVRMVSSRYEKFL